MAKIKEPRYFLEAAFLSSGLIFFAGGMTGITALD
jgi:hypothetical protein